jgi:hypothetical protein
LWLQLDAWLFVPPQPPRALDLAEHVADPVVAGHAKRFQLCMRAWKLGARTDAYDDAALGDAVERGQGVGQGKSVPKQGEQNRRAERDTSRGACHTGQEGDGLSARARQQ